MMREPDPRAGAGRHGTRTSIAAGIRWPRLRSRRLLIIAGSVLAAAAVAAAVLLRTGTFRHQLMTVHGTEQVVVSSFDGLSTVSAFPDITGGAPVTVVSPSGKVIGTGMLSPSDPASWGAQDSVYAFTVTVPADEPRYGIQIGRNRGTVWFTAQQMKAGPALSVSG